jgi:hypothetical protein
MGGGGEGSAYQTGYRSDPGRIKQRWWVLWAITQVLCIWGAVAAYAGMNSDSYHAGAWAWIACGPLVGIPLLWGWALLSGARAYADYQRWLSLPIPPPSIPKCDICGKNSASWNTRTNEWMDTCRDCRNTEYFDNDHTID